MKSNEDIRKIAEKEIPYDPYYETFFSGFRNAKIEGFIKGYQLSGFTIEDLKKAYEAGNLGRYKSFVDFLEDNM